MRDLTVGRIVFNERPPDVWDRPDGKPFPPVRFLGDMSRFDPPESRKRRKPTRGEAIDEDTVISESPKQATT